MANHPELGATILTWISSLQSTSRLGLLTGISLAFLRPDSLLHRWFCLSLRCCTPQTPPNLKIVQLSHFLSRSRFFFSSHRKIFVLQVLLSFTIKTTLSVSLSSGTSQRQVNIDITSAFLLIGPVGLISRLAAINWLHWKTRSTHLAPFLRDFFTMANVDALVNTMRSSQAAFFQQTANLPEAERQAKWAKYLQWVAAQASNGSEAQLSSSIPQKRSGSCASIIGMEPGSKRPSIVGP